MFILLTNNHNSKNQTKINNGQKTERIIYKEGHQNTAQNSKKIKIKSKKLDVKQLISQDLEYAYPCTIFLHLSPVLLPGKSHGWRSLVGCSP